MENTNMDIKKDWLNTPVYRIQYNASTNEVELFKKFPNQLYTFSPDDFIYWLFNHRCIMCKKYGTEINEITPRSRSKDALNDYRNRVPLCSSCHRDFHKDGVTTEKQRIMRMQREIFLIALGRKEFI